MDALNGYYGPSSMRLFVLVIVWVLALTVPMLKERTWLRIAAISQLAWPAWFAILASDFTLAGMIAFAAAVLISSGH